MFGEVKYLLTTDKLDHVMAYSIWYSRERKDLQEPVFVVV